MTKSSEATSLHNLLRSDPQRYMSVVNQRIQANPKDSQAYFDRHFAWMHLGQPRYALEDMDKVIEHGGGQSVDFMSRGDVHRHLGDYEKALQDYDRGEALNPIEWRDDAIGHLFQADCHARLGHEAEALAHCARLPDDFWTPGLLGAPAGDKARIADDLRRLAADARRKRV
jgi:tetratricopeptide (TPR) repeat protein